MERLFYSVSTMRTSILQYTSLQDFLFPYKFWLVVLLIQQVFANIQQVFEKLLN